MSYKLSPIPQANIMSHYTQNYTGTTDGQTVYLDMIDNTDGGITIENGTDVTFTNPGHYLMVISAIFSQSSGTNASYDIWFQKNGVDVPMSNTSVLIRSAGTASVVSVGIIGQVDVGGDYISLKWYCSSANGRMLATPPGTSPTRPLVPSLLITCNKVSD